MLPRYVVEKVRRTASGDRRDFYFSVKASLRPEGWPATVRLPRDASKRGTPGEIAAMLIDAAELNKALDAKRADCPTAANGTLNWLMDEWRLLPEWAAIKPKTRIFYEQGWNHVKAWSDHNNTLHVSRATWPIIYKFVSGYSDRPAVQRQVRQVLQKLTQIARDRGIISADPWEGQKRRRWHSTKVEQAKRVIAWADLVRIVQRCYRKGYPSMGRAAAAAFDTMQYPIDLIGMLHGEHYAGGNFVFDREKTGVPAVVPASQYTRALLSGTQVGALFVYEGTGRPYTRDHFNKVWRRCMKGSEYEGFEFRWFRHSGVAEADEAGVDERGIDAVGAWKPGGSGAAVRDAHYRKQNPKLAGAAQEKREQYRRGK